MGSLRSYDEKSPFHLGQRLSYDGVLCTVRYYGTLPDTKGFWLGVEWDDVDRGKHDGTYRGTKYFDCLSSVPTAGSFIRPTRTPSIPRSFLDALRFKYVAEDTDEEARGASKTAAGSLVPNDSVIKISGKVVQEVGFERVRQQQAALQNLRIVLLDGLRLSGVTLERHNAAATAAAQQTIAQTCPNLVELDLGWNLLETWTSMAEICLPLRKLQVLKASGLRLREFDLSQELEKKQPFRHITELHLNENLLQPEQIAILVRSLISELPRFPALKVLSVSQNRLSHLQTLSPYRLSLQLLKLEMLILDNNFFTSLAFLPDVLYAFPRLKVLSLQGNQISSIGLSSDQGSGEETFSYHQVESVNLSHNLVQDYNFIDALPRLFPRLNSLRVSNNPFFTTITSVHPLHDETPPIVTALSSTSSSLPAHTSVPSRISRSDAAYGLTLARIPSLLTLNHSVITSRDREEGEIYYVSLAEQDLAAALAGISSDTENGGSEINRLKKEYPRYEELCRKYDRDSVFDTRKASESRSALRDIGAHTAHAPGTLGARLLKTHFYISSPANFTDPDFIQTASTATSDQSSIRHTTFSRLVPRSISVYSLKALISRTFGLPALQFSLVYESPELDPVVHPRGGNEKATWEAWGDWDLDHPPQGAEKEGKKWKKREVEIVDGMREWGFYVEDGVDDVKVRVERLNSADGGLGTAGNTSAEW